MPQAAISLSGESCVISAFNSTPGKKHCRRSPANCIICLHLGHFDPISSFEGAKKMGDAEHFSLRQSDEPGRRPLAGKTVMLTRPPAQSVEMAARLEGLGATVIHCPTIQIVEPSSWEALDEAIGRLESYDWLIFTSANGVEFFFRRLGERRSDGLRAVSGLQTCAVGPATARAIITAVGRVDLTARESKAEGVLAASIEPVTTEALRAHGLTEIVQPPTYNAAALVEALAEALGRR